MIPQDFITEWRRRAPWVEDFQVEQDLVISRASEDSSTMFQSPTHLFLELTFTMLGRVPITLQLYIDGFYNRFRKHTRLNNLIQNEFEKNARISVHAPMSLKRSL